MCAPFQEPAGKRVSISRSLSNYRIAILFLVLGGMGGVSFIGWWDAQVALSQRKAVNDGRLHLERALSLLKDAETGQRGFLLTQDPAYLEPYNSGRKNFQAEYDAVASAFQGIPEVGKRLGPLKAAVAGKLAEMEGSIRFSQRGPREPGLPEMNLGRGKELMDTIRDLHDQLGALITVLAREADVKATGRFRRTLLEMTALAGLSFGGIAFFVFRGARFERLLLERTALLEQEVLQRNQAEEESRKLNLELLASNQELEAFAYTVAHDLRAPLRHVDGFTALLRKDLEAKASPRTVHHLDVIRQSSRRMGLLIDDLLTYSRLGRMELHKVPVPLSTLLAQVRLDLTEEEKAPSVEWRIGALPTVVGDPSLLRLVLQNLLSNALKFSRHRDHAVIEVGCDIQAGITLFVKDNGAGFDMRYLDKLFKPFQRLHQQAEFEGTGIGLASVDRVAKRHGGAAWAESVPDQGAAFFLFLPSEA